MATATSCDIRQERKSVPSLREKRRKYLEWSLSKKVGRAIADYRMIEDGDKILVAVSGGKDSLMLLKILSDRKVFVPIDYDVIAVYVDTGFASAPQELLKEFCQELGYSLVTKKIHELKEAPSEDVTCFWCSWNRRKALFEMAKVYGCNKVAFGHHKDDIIQTTLMNLLFVGEISTMAPFQKMFDGKLALIRPLAYVEKREIAELAELSHWPTLDAPCANAATSKRTSVAKFIDELQRFCPSVKTNIFRSLKRIKTDYLL